MDSKVYIIGGSDGIRYLNTIICIDLVSGEVKQLQPMNERRCFHAAISFGRYLIVCGGNNGTERLRSCELYDPVLNRWRFIASMNTIRSDASAAVLGNKIYIAGGIDVFMLSSVEFYSFPANHWTTISFMHFPRRSFTLLSYNEHLYAIGGCSDVYEFNRLVDQIKLNNILKFCFLLQK